jgi:hypothetical protein
MNIGGVDTHAAATTAVIDQQGPLLGGQELPAEQERAVTATGWC